MLSPEEEKFIKYWEENRVLHSSFLSKLTRGLPMAMIFGLPILLLIVIIYFLSPEWYTKVSSALAGSTSIVVIAVFIAILFYAFIRMHFKWEMNDQLYRELKQKEKRSNAANEALNNS
jgi:TRAP-type uncharacterized transport system fused permease subunit